MVKESPIVFISYARENGLSSRVKSLADWLISKGVQVVSDHQFTNAKAPREGFYTWMQHSIEDADLVLIVCTERYKNLFERRNDDLVGGYGVTWESAFVVADIYQARLVNERYVPILPENGQINHVPTVLKQFYNDLKFPNNNEVILSLIRNEGEILPYSKGGNIAGESRKQKDVPENIQITSIFHGNKRNEILADLIENWKSEGPVVAIIQGLPGTGKSELARELATYFFRPIPLFEPQNESNSCEKDLLIDLADSLEEEGLPSVALELEKGSLGDPFSALLKLIRQEPILIIFDEFQRLFESAGTAPSHKWRRLIEKANNSPSSLGRLIFISNRVIHKEHWCESSKFVELKGLSDDEAGGFLCESLETKGLSNKVPADLLSEIGRRLGGNPRAIMTLVAGLMYESLEDLMSLYSDENALDDVRIDPLLLEQFERDVIDRTLRNIDTSLLKIIRFVSAHRRPFDKSAILSFCDDKLAVSELRRQLIDRYLLSNSVWGDELHPLVREISVSRLAEQPEDWISAHNAAADYNLSRFRLSRRISTKKIASSYSELRYHLHQAGRMGDLNKIDERILKNSLSDLDKPAQSKVPDSVEILEERISILSLLPSDKLSKGLEYHLALCLKHRNLGNDYENALIHIRNAVGPHSYYAAWLLLIDLEYEINGIQAMIEAKNTALRHVKGENNSFSLYHRCSEILSREDQLEDAIKILKEGIDAPGTTCLEPLIGLCADRMQEAGRVEDAIDLIKSHLDDDLPHISILYKRCADLMLLVGDTTSAIAILQEAIGRQGITHLYSIYLKGAHILESMGKSDDALSFLEEALTDKGVKDGIEVYKEIASIYIRLDQPDKAISTIQRGLFDRSIQQPESIYKYYSDLLEKLGRLDEATAIMKDFLKETRNPSSFQYLSCATTLFHLRDLDGAIEILREGISRPKLTEQWQLIRMCSEMFYRKGDVDSCISTLQKGIDNPIIKNKFPLYKFYSDILIKENQIDEAVKVLKSGINSPAIGNKSVLIQACAKLLDKAGRSDDALIMIRKYLSEPGITGVVMLYQACAKIMSGIGDNDGAIKLLQDSFKGPKIGNLVSLYKQCAEIMLADGRLDDAKETLAEGLRKFPGDKSLDKLYSSITK